MNELDHYKDMTLTLDEFERFARSVLGVYSDNHFSFGLHKCNRCGKESYYASFLDERKAKREYDNGEWSSGYMFARIENVRYINRVCPYCYYPEDENFYCVGCDLRISLWEDRYDELFDNDGICPSCGKKMIFR